MKNKLGIISGLILSLMIAGSAFAGVTTTKDNKAKNKAVAAKASNNAKKPKKHRKAKHVKKMKTTKKTTTSTGK